MIYLVGGPPRVRKTQLVKAVLERRPMHAVSTDAVRYMLRRTIPKDVLSSALFSDDADNLNDGNFQAVLESQNEESRQLWPYLVQLINSYTEDGCDLLLEGVAVLPELVTALKVPHRAVIIGNSSPEHTVTLLQHAAHNTHNWLHAYLTEQTTAYAGFFAHMDAWLRTEASRYDLPFVEIHDDRFAEDIAGAAKVLLS